MFSRGSAVAPAFRGQVVREMAPPRRALLPARVPERNPLYLAAIPKVELAQAKRFATGVLEHYNKRKNIKFELLDAKPGISIPERTHTLTSLQGPAKKIRRTTFSSLRFTTVAKGWLQVASLSLAVTHWALILQ